MRPNRLLEELVAAEEEFRRTTFLAPCVAGGSVRARVAGLVITFHPQPAEFEGWGIFRPAGPKVARLEEEAGLPLIAGYLRLLKPLRMRLACALQRRTWLAYPANESDARQRFGEARPAPVHLVEDAAPFEAIIARWDGGSWWYEEPDRRADPALADGLCDALRRVVAPNALRLKGLTPEMRAAYDLAAQQAEGFRALMERRRAEGRLGEALQRGGGRLRGYREHEDHWVVDWVTTDGRLHTSAIAKRDLTVLSAGICLSGEDQRFDLQSLVGVVEGGFQIAD